MGLDIEKIKVKKDSKDAQLKAQALFKKATTAITFANRAQKKVNEKIASHGDDSVQEHMTKLSTVKEEQQPVRPGTTATARKSNGGASAVKVIVKDSTPKTGTATGTAKDMNSFGK